MNPDAHSRWCNAVVSKFNDEQRAIVKDTGFKGLLDFPPAKQMYRRFAVSLMCRVDNLSISLILPNREIILFSNNDIGKVFGIPCKGNKIDDHLCTQKKSRWSFDFF